MKFKPLGDRALVKLVEREETLRHRALTTSESRLSQLMTQIRAQGGEAEGAIGVIGRFIRARVG